MDGRIDVPEDGGRRRGSVADWLFGNASNDCAYAAALLALRLMLGVIFIYHGSQKAFGAFGGSGYENTVKMVEKIGFPAAHLFAVLLICGELGGGLMVLTGLATRFGAFLISIVMIVALWRVHIPMGDGFEKTHLQQLVLAACVSLMITGGGPISLYPGRRHTHSEKCFTPGAEEVTRDG